jgi:hypothetical protein
MALLSKIEIPNIILPSKADAMIVTDQTKKNKFPEAILKRRVLSFVIINKVLPITRKPITGF